MKELFLQAINEGLTRHAMTDCARYAERVRVMGLPYAGPWSFKHHPWLREMHNPTSEIVIGQKSAQMGYTETALNRTFYMIDREKKNVLYILPNKSPDATDFTNARFAPALELSRHLRSLFTDINNVGHKRAGNANLYIRGSKAKAGLRSIPVQAIIFDELDVMDQDNIPLALERVSGQLTKSIFMLSTPTIPNFGINKYYVTSDQRNFFFRCPSCSRSINLEFPRNIEIVGDDPYSQELEKTRLFCHLCKATLQHERKTDFLKHGTWVASRSSTAAGYYINQLYSPTIKPYELARKYLNGLRNEAGEQEFYNSALGLPHVVAGSRLTDEIITACKAEHRNLTVPPAGYVVTMGVDVGKFLHVEIDLWTFSQVLGGVKSHAKLLAALKVDSFEALYELIERFKVSAVVLDMNPERQKARDFVVSLKGLAEMCEYPSGDRGKEIVVYDEENRIQVDRTAWLDVSLGRVRAKAISLPVDLPYEYTEHLKALTKFYYRDQHGNIKARYIKGTDDDHYAHARNYSEIAFARFVLRSGVSQAENPLF